MKRIKITLITFMIIFTLFCSVSDVFCNGKYIDNREMTNIEYVLGEAGLNILLPNHSGSTITISEMIDILIKYTNVSNEMKAASLYSIGTISKNKAIMYGDFHVSEDKEELVRRLIVTGILPEKWLIYPNRNCTWKDAVEFVTAISDRCGLFNEVYGGLPTELNDLLNSKLPDDETQIYDNLKSLLFYSLFSVLTDTSEGFKKDFYYEPVTDIMYLCHDCYYKLGYAQKSDKGIIIDGEFFQSNLEINFYEYVLCIYSKNGDTNEVRAMSNVSDYMYNKIKGIKSFYKIEPNNKTFKKDFTINSDGFNKSMEPVDIHSFLSKMNIDLWQDNSDNTIKRAQVVKTAFQLAGNDFHKYKTSTQDLPFKDVSKDNIHYNYISAAYNAGVIEGNGNGYFFPDKSCSYSEAIKIFSCFKGWKNEAENLAYDNNITLFPKAYFTVLEQFNVLGKKTAYDDILSKRDFVELVWHFICIPSCSQTN